ncbi:unnamed protein product [Cylicocyclus nassatus]|uniref:DNA primase n=1 Tax=Cylicocyclus nassatus TaxID=53992 RepID=A0AA36GQW2_CYLNA|nr:unnamed protein product [Cylicocyclus nassatus]
MRRHLAFQRSDDLQIYLKTTTPSHVYYSTAFYAHPAAPNMQDKEWLGAELIFDLDADHILHAAYDVMLARVKEDLLKLIDMLTQELGFNRNDLHINFSGGRGYHIHIPLMSVRGWSSSERRELTNYVSGTGITSTVMFDEGHYAGWKQRFTEAAIEELTYLSSLPPAEAQSALMGLSGFTEKTSLHFCKTIPHLLGRIKENPSALKNNTLLKTILSPELNSAFRERILARSAQTDEPVTTDIKRLIRFPGSLHGGSGMRVVPIDIGDIDEFDPLVDAVVFDESPITVTCNFPLTMQMLGNTYTLAKGNTGVMYNMTKLTISDLHGYILDERSIGSLGEIPGTLYEQVALEIARIGQEVSTSKEFFSEGFSSLYKERESLRELLRELYALRTKKIVNIAYAAANGEEVDRNQLRMMVRGERALYDVVYDSCCACRNILLEGKQILEVTAYNYAAPESPVIEDASPDIEEIPAEMDNLTEIVPESDACRAETAPESNRVVAIRSAISEFQDLSGRIYSLSPGDVVSLPQQMADILCKDNKALSIRIR